MKRQIYRQLNRQTDRGRQMDGWTKRHRKKPSRLKEREEERDRQIRDGTNK